MAAIFLALLATSVAYSCSAQSCSSFENVLVQLKDKNDVRFNETIDGCIERIKFENRTIVSAYVRKQDIKKLGRDSVRNMGQLNTLSFWACAIDEVEQGAFRNLPKLRNLQISYCNLKEVKRGW